VRDSLILGFDLDECFFFRIAGFYYKIIKNFMIRELILFLNIYSFSLLHNHSASIKLI